MGTARTETTTIEIRMNSLWLIRNYVIDNPKRFSNRIHILSFFYDLIYLVSQSYSVAFIYYIFMHPK